MSSHESTHFPKRVLKRYAEILLRHVYQCGGRDRYVSVEDIADTLGLEEELILQLCRTQLLGEIHVADRIPAELQESVEFRTPLERQCARLYFSEPHVRIRPACVRLTQEELLSDRKKRSAKKKRRRKNQS